MCQQDHVYRQKFVNCLKVVFSKPYFKFTAKKKENKKNDIGKTRTRNPGIMRPWFYLYTTRNDG